MFLQLELLDGANISKPRLVCLLFRLSTMSSKDCMLEGVSISAPDFANWYRREIVVWLAFELEKGSWQFASLRVEVSSEM